MSGQNGQSLPEFTPEQLSACDVEPIHLIGAVQNAGFLLVASSDWLVTNISGNIGAFLDLTPEACLGQPLTALLGGEAVHDIRGHLQMLDGASASQRMFNVRLGTSGGLFNLNIHRHQDNILIEAEKFSEEDVDVANSVQPFFTQLRQASSLARLCSLAARQVRILTGFDRVMVYKFHADGSGEVITETKLSSLPAYLGLRYPASDIPAKARELYQSQLIRVIGDVGEQSAPLLPPHNMQKEPVDLSLCALRAVPEVHLEYLRNMGVCASLSISIMRGKKLWGLIACHHTRPRHISFQRRAALEFLAHIFSSFLETQLQAEELQRVSDVRALHNTMLTQLTGDAGSIDDVAPQIGRAQEMIHAHGFCTYMDGHLRLHGRTPTHEQTLPLLHFLNRAAASQVYTTNHLSSVYPEAVAYTAEASGVLAVPISRRPRDYIVFFRPELRHSVTWAGMPAKEVTRTDDGMRIGPRKSFAAWHETIEHQSAPWEEADCQTGESLRVTLLEVMLQITDKVEKQRKHEHEKQDLLIAELNHRVRNILNLIVGLVRQSADKAGSVDEFARDVQARVQALARAHDQITAGGWRAQSVHKMIRVEAGAYLGDKADRIIITGPDMAIQPEAFSTVALVMHELITNAAKYGAFRDSDGSVDVDTAYDPDIGLSITWREHCGGPVKAPTRRGFGSAIIERAIPHELAGTASITFEPQGLLGQFVIPSRHVERCEQDQAAAMAADRPVSAHADKLAGTVMLLEDNLLIALETEEMLYAVGAQDVLVASTTVAALEILANTRPDLAVLDYNLGHERSVRVAEKLDQLGIPFIFATGYGDSEMIDERFRDRRVLTKPYSTSNILEAYERMHLPSARVPGPPVAGQSA